MKVTGQYPNKAPRRNERRAERARRRPDGGERRHAEAMQRAREAERALAEAREALASSDRELQEFAYVASHDLQEPLRKILSFADLLRMDCADALDETGTEYLDRMQDAARRMSGLLDGLLAFSRVRTKAQPFERVALDDVVAGVLEELEEPLRASGGTFDVGSLPVVEADPAQMRQLFRHLVENALKFHREEARPHVEIRAEEEVGGAAGGDGAAGAVCRIVVRDDGIGFDEKYGERIFAPFQRLHGRGAYPGSGMGLAVCRRIVARHGGAITAAGTPGEGSTFAVTLPLRQAGAAAG